MTSDYDALRDRTVAALRASARDLKKAENEVARTPAEIGMLRAQAEAARVLAGQVETLRCGEQP